jgi:MFS family permease
MDQTKESQLSIDPSLEEQPPKKSWCSCYNMIHFLIPLLPMVWAYPYDFPMNFATPLREKLGMTDNELQNLYAGYNLPNVICPIIFGIIINRYGLRSTYGLLALCLLGEGTFAMGVSNNMFWLQYMGRFIFGMGAESTFLTTYLQIKMFIPENLMIIFFALSILNTRFWMWMGTFVRFQMYKATQNF